MQMAFDHNRAMKIVLICHDGALLDQVVLARWLNSFSHLVGIVVIEEPPNQLWRRVRREIKRIGILRFLDVLAFQFYYRLFLDRKDRSWGREELRKKCLIYGDISSNTAILRTSNPNSQETETFLGRINPDLILARCKVSLQLA
jgi:hypothetical protein